MWLRKTSPLYALDCCMCCERLTGTNNTGKTLGRTHTWGDFYVLCVNGTHDVEVHLIIPNVLVSRIDEVIRSESLILRKAVSLESKEQLSVLLMEPLEVQLHSFLTSALHGILVVGK